MATHEIDAATAGLTATLHLEKQTEQIGDGKARIMVPKKRDWRTLTA